MNEADISKVAWDNWIAYRKRNSSMTIEEEQEIMEEMGVFDDWPGSQSEDQENDFDPTETNTAYL